jgi:hypothetical protein
MNGYDRNVGIVTSTRDSVIEMRLYLFFALYNNTSVNLLAALQLGDMSLYRAELPIYVHSRNPPMSRAFYIHIHIHFHSLALPTYTLCFSVDSLHPSIPFYWIDFFPSKLKI